MKEPRFMIIKESEYVLRTLRLRAGMKYHGSSESREVWGYKYRFGV